MNTQYTQGNVDLKAKKFRNSDDVLQLQTLDNFKELIYKMDEKMGESGMNYKYDNNDDYMDSMNKQNDSRAVNISLTIPNDRFAAGYKKNDDEAEFLEGNAMSNSEQNYHIENEIERHIAEIKSAYRF